MTLDQRKRARWAFITLVLGAVGIGIAPLFVRTSEVGPAATGLFRMVFAIPFLAWELHRTEARLGPTPAAGPKTKRLLWAAGLFFAADIALWHYSIVTTSVANATLLTNMAPVFVVIVAWQLFGDRPTPLFLLGLLLALIGATLLVGDSLRISRETALGDLMGLASAVFYAGYQLAIKRVRSDRSAVAVMLASTTVTGVGLLGVALLAGENLIPTSWQGAGGLVLLALVSQVLGQGLIVYGLLHLPSGFAAVTLLVQPVVAAALAWSVLGETLTPWQGLGGLVVLTGILVARFSTLGASGPPAAPRPGAT